MSKPLKITMIILSIPVILLLIIALILKITINEDFIKSQITPIVESSTGRNLTVGGASVQLFPSLGIVLEDVTLSDDPSFSHSPFVKSGRFVVGVKLLPLLGKKIVVDEVGLSDLTIYVIKNQDGIFNFSSLSKKDSNTVETKVDSSHSNPMSSLGFLVIDNFHIDNSSVSYIDLSTQQQLTIAGLNYHLNLDFSNSVWDLNHDLTIDRISFSTAMGSLIKDIPLSLKQKLNYDLTNDHLSIKETDFSLSAIKLGIQGDVKGVQDSIRDIQLVVESGDTDLQQFLSLVPSSIVKQVNDIQTRGTFKFSVEVLGKLSPAQIPTVNYLFDLNNGYMKYSSLPAALSDIKIHLKGDANNIEDFLLSAAVKQSKFSVSARVMNFKEPDVAVKAGLNFNLSDVKDFYPLEPNQSVSGKINADFNISGKPLTPKTLIGNGEIIFDHLSLKDKNLPKGIQEIDGKISVSNDYVLLNALTILTGSSDITLTGKVTNYLGFVLSPDSTKLIPTVQSSLTSQNLDIADFVDLEKETSETRSDESVTQRQLPILPNMTANFTASISKFRFKDIQANNSRSTISIKDQTIKITQTKTDIFGGHIGLDAGLEFKNGDQSMYSSKLSAADLKSTEFLTLVPSVESYVKLGKYLKGDISFSGDLGGILTDTLAPKLDAVTALGSVTIKNGVLKDHPIQNGIADYLGVDEVKNLTLDNWTTGLEIKDGKLYLKDLKANSKSTGLEAEANGYQSLDQSIRYEVTLHLPKWMTEKTSKSEYGKIATSYFTDANNKIMIDLLITGTFDNPKIAPDPTKSAGRAANQLTNKVKEEANRQIDSAKEAAKKEAEKAADDAKKKAEEEAKKKLKKLFGN